MTTYEASKASQPNSSGMAAAADSVPDALLRNDRCPEIGVCHAERTQIAITANEQRYRHLFECMPICIER